MACIAANLGAGLDYNESTRRLEMALSRDAGNAARIGTDGGFWAPAASAPGPVVWPKTVATLPAQAIAATGGGNIVLPSTAPGAIEYAIANDIDIYLTSACAGGDGTALEIIDGRNNPTNRYTDNPADIDWGHLGSTQAPSLIYDTGTRVSPTARNAPSEFTDPDGGWAGYYARPFNVRTVAELLRMVRGRIVVAIIVNIEGHTTDAEAIAEVEAVVRAVVEAGAQEWVIILPQAFFEADRRKIPLAQIAPIITGAGITAGLQLYTEADEPATFSPAEIVASGATWVEVASPSHPAGSSAARIGEFVAAGVQTMVYTDGRQYWTDWAFGLGARAIRCGDAVYARGGRGATGDLAYRQTFIPGLSTRTAANGAISPNTALHTAVYSQGFARQDEPGRWFPARYGWDGDTAIFTNHQLLGTVCPTPDTVNFELRLRLFHGPNDNQDSSRWAGIFWGAADDRDISQPRGAANNPNRNGYNCVVFEPVGSTATRMGIYRHDAGVSTTLNDTNGGPGWAESEWVELIVTVTGGNINFQAVAPGLSGVVTTTDTTYRGPYAFYTWNNRGVFSGTNLFWHGYDNGRTEAGELMVYAAQS